MASVLAHAMPTPSIGTSSRYLSSMAGTETRPAAPASRQRAGGGRGAVGGGQAATEVGGQRRQPEREGEADGGVHREAVARPRDALVVLGRARRAAEDVPRDRDT